jgi:hypothetical protein
MTDGFRDMEKKSNTQPGNHKGLPLGVGLPHIDVGAILYGCPESWY